jgi:hypothetical protein
VTWRPPSDPPTTSTTNPGHHSCTPPHRSHHNAPQHNVAPLTLNCEAKLLPGVRPHTPCTPQQHPLHITPTGHSSNTQEAHMPCAWLVMAAVGRGAHLYIILFSLLLMYLFTNNIIPFLLIKIVCLMQSKLGLSLDWALYLFFLTNYLHLSRVQVVCLESGRSLRTVLGLS